MSYNSFILHSDYSPSGDQVEAIAKLVDGVESGASHQVLQGITGSGKTFTMANVIHRLKRPTLILAHNKTLAAQFYSEMKRFFPENHVEYFVSYYDFYQPEVYIPASDRFIRKDSAINEQLERLRLSTTKALIEQRDVIVVASVSAIYGLGEPELYRAAQIPLYIGRKINRSQFIEQLTSLQYQRTEKRLERATFRSHGDIVDIFPAESEKVAIRVEMLDDEIEQLYWLDPFSGKTLGALERYRVSPKTLYAASKDKITKASLLIQKDLEQRVAQLNQENRITEAARLYERTMYDIEMMQQLGYCSGLENYSCYLNDRDPTLPPTTLLDYLPKDGLLFIDESHVMIPQISAMFKGDQSRKETLIEYGFRLPSAKNNRPLDFNEFEKIKPQTLFVSATPGNYELSKAKTPVVEQIIRPTGLLDPTIEVRSSSNQISNLLDEIKIRIEKGERTLVNTLTKKSAESLYEYMQEQSFKVSYLHSDVKTEDRVRIIEQLRAGELDILIGINLLREGLDIPEASLVAILDADHAGFLRSKAALIQIIGRAARNKNGMAILYGNKVTPAMQQAIDESLDRRSRQIQYNHLHQINPITSIRQELVTSSSSANPEFCTNLAQLCQQITDTEKLLLSLPEGENSESIRTKLDGLYRQFIYM
ncbi:excinuclease ABC subunit UvrB [Photobacterium damselae]|uniref:excinuclease ABC subunit UvrB n=1 Tax=Photobacterium damselae TaxID=38293 RepID=UPI0035A9A4FA